MHYDEDMSKLRGGAILCPREFVLSSFGVAVRVCEAQSELSFLWGVIYLAEQHTNRACSDQRGG